MLSFDTPKRELYKCCTIRSTGTNTVLRPGESRQGDGRKKKRRAALATQRSANVETLPLYCQISEGAKVQLFQSRKKKFNV